MTVYDEIHAERVREHAKHGDTSMEAQPIDDPTGLRRDIITEENGEIAREFNDARHDGRPVDLAKLRKELIQLAAMASAWADAILVQQNTGNPFAKVNDIIGAFKESFISGMPSRQGDKTNA